jgi:hypothetical protein
MTEVSGMSDFAFGRLQPEQVRARLQKMGDAALIEFGKNCRFLCRPHRRKPNPSFVMQLNEAVEEWKRRHPSSASL